MRNNKRLRVYTLLFVVLLVGVVELSAKNSVVGQPAKTILLESIIRFKNEPGIYEGQFHGIAYKAAIKEVSQEENRIVMRIDIPAKFSRKSVFIKHNLDFYDIKPTPTKVLVKEGFIFRSKEEVELVFKILEPQIGSRGTLCCLDYLPE